MKKLISFLATTVILCSLFTSTAFADSGGYTITNYKVSGVLKENNVMQMTETIDVNFRQSRHGIYRSIPTEMYVSRIVEGQPKQMHYRNQVSNISVEGEKYSYEMNGEYMDIRIGDADKYVTGKHRYKISYDLVMTDDRVADSDFLFYSVLGNEWKTDIKKFSFDIAFEKEIPKSAVDAFKVYSGDFGSQGNDLKVKYNLSESGISGKAKNIQPQSAITLYTDLPQGYFVGAETVPTAPAWTFAIISVAVCAIILIKIFTGKKDNIVQTVEFYPPDGISSAEVGYIIDSSADLKDLVSLIPWWANKGYIKIEDKTSEGKKIKKGKSHLILYKVKDLPQNSPEYQKKLFNAIFSNNESCDIDETAKKSEFGKQVSKAMEKLEAGFDGDRALYKNKGLPIAISLAVCVLNFMALGLSGILSLTENMFIAWLASGALFIAGLLYADTVTKNRFEKKSTKIFKAIGAVILLCVAAGVYYICTSECGAGLKAVLAVSVIMTFFASIFAGRIVKRTDYNIEITGKLLGLRHFIETAEMPRLKILVDENPSYYYDVLPYAMVFGLSNKWADLFSDIDIGTPSWYYGSGDIFTVYYLNRMMNDVVSKSNIGVIEHQNSVAKSQSSITSGGGFSGGFSGGGGGGGGGGSW